MSQQVIKLVVKGSLLAAVQTRLSFFYGCDAPRVDADDLDVCEASVDILLNDACPVMNVSVLFYGIDAYVRDAEGKWMLRKAYTIAEEGFDEGDLNTFQLAALIEATTGVFRARGRKFLPGIAKLSTDMGSISSAALAYLIQVVADYIAPAHSMVTGRTWFPGVISKRSAFAPFVSGAINTVLSTIRRRKPGYGI